VKIKLLDENSCLKKKKAFFFFQFGFSEKKTYSRQIMAMDGRGLRQDDFADLVFEPDLSV
jgi:hypothetical protein